jgi:hypothetical protein
MASRPAAPRPRRAPSPRWRAPALLSLAPSHFAAGLPFGDRPRAPVPPVDDAGVLLRQPELALDDLLGSIATTTGTDIVVFLRSSPPRSAGRGADAQALLDEGTGGADGDGVADDRLDRQKQKAIAAIAAGAALDARVGRRLDGIVADAVDAALADGEWLTAVTGGIVVVHERRRPDHQRRSRA